MLFISHNTCHRLWWLCIYLLSVSAVLWASQQGPFFPGHQCGTAASPGLVTQEAQAGLVKWGDQGPSRFPHVWPTCPQLPKSCVANLSPTPQAVSLQSCILRDSYFSNLYKGPIRHFCLYRDKCKMVGRQRSQLNEDCPSLPERAYSLQGPVAWDGRVLSLLPLCSMRGNLQWVGNWSDPLLAGSVWQLSRWLVCILLGCCIFLC